jgi:threonine dehydratase
MDMTSTLPVKSADIDQAANVVAPFAVRTPLLSFPILDARVGTRVFLKA